MPDSVIARLGALDGLQAGSLPTSIRTLPPAARFALRGRPAAVEAAGPAFGVALPQDACRAAVAGSRAALWLGPDEWLLLAPEAESAAIAGDLGSALAGLPHALVEISHRNTAFEVAGPDAGTVLNAGCPLDLHLNAFPVGMCTRTMLAKAEIVLWRTAPDTFRVEVWRSFASYAWHLLDEAARNVAAAG